MSKAINYLEKVSKIDESVIGESFEVVSINEAFVALELRELEVLQQLMDEHPNWKSIIIDTRIAVLNKKLKNIKR